MSKKSCPILNWGLVYSNSFLMYTESLRAVDKLIFAVPTFKLVYEMPHRCHYLPAMFRRVHTHDKLQQHRGVREGGHVSPGPLIHSISGYFSMQLLMYVLYTVCPRSLHPFYTVHDKTYDLYSNKLQ